MGEFTTIETQEALDKIIGERLSRDREAQAKKYEGYVKPEDYAAKCKEYDDTIAGLQKTIDDGKSIAEELESAKAQLKNYEIGSVKTKVAHEMGLPYEMAGRLRGETEEDIRKDAETMKSLFPKKAAPPLRSDEDTPEDSNKAAMKKMLNDLKGE